MDREGVKDELRNYALAQGADMVGFANIERFDNAPAEVHPRNIYPNARTVIVIGMRVLRGLMDSLDNQMFIPYNAHGYGGINEQFMPNLKQRVASWLEDRGHTGVPVTQWTGTPHQEPIMCHRTAAVAAGLGEFGWSKVFLSKRFGPLQRFGIVMTDADWPSDPLVTERVCDGCKACVRGCPSGAISRDTAVTLTIGGQTFTHAKVDMFACTQCHHGGMKASHPMPPADFDISDIEKRYAARPVKLRDDTEAYVVGLQAAREVQAKYPHPLFGIVGMLARSCAHCGARGCFRSCLEHLEKKGVLDQTFVHRYRESGPEATNAAQSRRAAGITRSVDGEEVYKE